MPDNPSHLIIVVNADTQELKVVSSHTDEKDADVCFENFLSLIEGTNKRVHKVPVPSQTGFVSVEVTSAPEYHQPAPARPPAPSVAASKPEPFKRIVPEDEPTDANGFPVGRDLDDGFGRTI